MPDADGTITVQDLLNGGDMNKLTAVLQRLKLGDMLASPRKETLTIGVAGGFAANTVVLSRRAALIENVYDETDNETRFVIPTGETPATGVSCAISADRVTLTFHADEDGNDVTVTYLSPDTDITLAAGF